MNRRKAILMGAVSAAVGGLTPRPAAAGRRRKGTVCCDPPLKGPTDVDIANPSTSNCDYGNPVTTHSGMGMGRYITVNGTCSSAVNKVRIKLTKTFTGLSDPHSGGTEVTPTSGSWTAEIQVMNAPTLPETYVVEVYGNYNTTNVDTDIRAFFLKY